MREVSRLIRLACLLAALFGSAATSAEEQSARCADIDSAAERLACYDAAAAAEQAEAPSSEKPERQTRAPDAPVEARIASIQTTSLGRHRFELDNGEIWEQAESQHIPLRAGDTVSIKRSLFGAHYMREADRSSRSVKVRRVQ